MISIVLATHNEQANLKRCLDSIAKFADEIIIADGASTDDTLEIVKSFNAKIIKTTNKANFHINKQMAMDKARGQLVLQLDADEVVDKELAKFITKTHAKISQLSPKELKQTQPKAYNLKRRNFFLGHFLKKGGQYPDPVIRLYVNGYARLPQKDVHEQMTVDGEVAWADGHLLHYSSPTFKEYLRKSNNYTSLKASQLKTAHVKINLPNTFEFMLVKPIATFLSLFIRHKGFVDGVAGFIFALFSGIYWQVSYLKLWESYQKRD